MEITSVIVVLVLIIVVTGVAVAVALYLERRASDVRYSQISDERNEALLNEKSAKSEKDIAMEANRQLAADKVVLIAERDKAQHDLAAAEVLHKTQIEALSSRLHEIRSECEAVRSRVDRIRAERNDAKHELAAVKADHCARSQELAKAREQIDTQFKGIASDAVKATNETFLEYAREQFNNQRKLSDSELEKRQQAIASLVKPVAENLNKFQKRVGELEEKREGAYRGLEKELTLLRNETVNLREATGSFSEAMRSSHVRGMWGEQQLRRILELSGMRKHIDFYEQVTESTDDGYVRPDAVVRVPGGIEVVIDAKSPLTSYLDACNTNDDKQREELHTRHARSLIGHARTLSAKKYSDVFVRSPDFTLMFVPADPILDVAMEVLPALWEDAWTKYRVLIATPGLLLAFLRTTALAWQQQSLQENAQEIADQGMELYKRLRIYTGHVVEVGRSLGRTVDAYNKSIGSMEARLLPQARKFEELGPAAHLTKSTKVEAAVKLDVIPRVLTAPELNMTDSP